MNALCMIAIMLVGPAVVAKDYNPLHDAVPAVNHHQHAFLHPHDPASIMAFESNMPPQGHPTMARSVNAKTKMKAFEIPMAFEPVRLAVKDASGNIALVDSSYTFDGDNNLMAITRYHYSETAQLILEEEFGHSIIDQTWMQLPKRKRELAYDSQGHIISDKIMEYDFNNEVEGDYFVTSLTEYEYNEERAQTYYCLHQGDWATKELIKVAREQRRFDTQTGQEEYYLREMGVNNEWAPLQLREITFFEDGNRKTNLSLRANPPGIWVSGYRQEYSGWHNGQTTGSVYQTWSQAQQDWENHSRAETEFDEDGKQKMLTFLWDAATEDYWHSQNEYTEYNDEGYYVYLRREKRPNPESDFINETLVLRTFNSQGYPLTTLIQNWDEAQQQWVNEAMAGYSYNEQGQQTTYLQQRWDIDTESWIGTNRYTVEYYKDDLIRYSLNEVYSDENQAWAGQNEQVNEYNHADQLIVQQYRGQQDPATSKWRFGSKSVYGYDQYGHMARSQQYTWSEPEQSFSESFTLELINDLYGNRKQEKQIFGQEVAQTIHAFVTYQLQVTVKNDQTPIENALFHFNGMEVTSDANGVITTLVTTGPDMLLEYTLEKDGFVSKQGSLKIDQHLQETLVLAPSSMQTYAVNIVVTIGTEVVENAEVYLAGYGIKKSDAEGIARFDEVAPADNMMFYVSHAGLYYEGICAVTSQSLDIRVDLATVSTNEPTAQLFALYPNPASGRVTLDMPDMHHADVGIFSIDGRQVYAATLQNGNHTIDISHLPKGLYVVRLTHDQGQFTQKLQVY